MLFLLSNKMYSQLCPVSLNFAEINSYFNLKFAIFQLFRICLNFKDFEECYPYKLNILTVSNQPCPVVFQINRLRAILDVEGSIRIRCTDLENEAFDLPLAQGSQRTQEFSFAG